VLERIQGWKFKVWDFNKTRLGLWHQFPMQIRCKSSRGKPSSREGKVHIGAYLHPDFKSSLRLVQAQTGKDIQALLSQALNELFRAYNVPVVDQS
jgi:hypothetical protein